MRTAKNRRKFHREHRRAAAAKLEVYHRVSDMLRDTALVPAPVPTEFKMVAKIRRELLKLAQFQERR